MAKSFIDIAMKKSQLHKNLLNKKKIESIVRQASIEAIRQSQEVGLKKVVELTEKVSGRTRLSWKISPIRSIRKFTTRGEVFSRSAGARVGETGAKFKSFPPRKKIEDWIMQKGVVPRNPNIDMTKPSGLRKLGFLIGKKIKDDDIKPKEITTKANRAIQDDLKKISKKMGVTITSKLKGRRG